MANQAPKIPKMDKVCGHLRRQVAIFVHTFMRMLSFMMQDHQDRQDDQGEGIADCGLSGQRPRWPTEAQDSEDGHVQNGGHLGKKWPSSAQRDEGKRG
jgi:hypothetical protein